jgi:hypothetical protein
LSKRFKGDDLNILGNLFTAIGGMLALMAAREACDSSNAQTDNQSGTSSDTQSEDKSVLRPEDCQEDDQESDRKDGTETSPDEKKPGQNSRFPGK